MKPEDFYEMEMEDFTLKAEGFRDGRIKEERIFRRLAQIIQSCAPFIKQPPSMLKQWPIAKDDEIFEQVKVNREKNAVATLAQFIKNAQGEKPLNEN